VSVIFNEKRSDSELSIILGNLLKKKEGNYTPLFLREA